MISHWSSRICCLFAVAVGAFLAAEPCAADETLRYRFKQGEVAKYIVEQSTQMDMQVPNADRVKTVMKQTMYLETTTDELLADGGARQRQAIRRITLTMKTEGGPVSQAFEWDSASDEEPTEPIAKILMASLKPMIDAEWKQTVSPRGEISDIEVPEKMTAALKANPGAAMMGAAGTPDGLKTLTSQAATVFPEQPVKAGDAWDTTVDLKMPFGLMKTKKITKYEGSNDAGQAKMGLGAEITFEPAAKAPAEMKITRSDADGEMTFDNKEGKILKSNLHQETEMEITAGGQSITQTITADVLMRIDDGREETTERTKPSSDK